MNKTIIIGINLGDFGSTGNIMRNTLEYAHKHGNYDYLVIVPKSENKPNTYAYEYKRNIFQKIIDRFIFLSRLKADGFKYYFFTKRIISKIKEKYKEYDECIIHLHNIHHCEINLPLLFKALSKLDIKIYYTLHDGWAITGGCYCFNYIKCRKWESGCNGKCPQSIGNKLFSPNYYWNKKKNSFELIKDKLTLICVSNWLKQELSLSYLKDFESIVINGETSLTSLGYKDEELKMELGLANKYILLTISAYWNDWKGISYLYKVADLLPKDYILLVVGGYFNTKNYKNIMYIQNISNEELNAYYSIADCFVSTTQDDNCPLVLMESQICGTPIVGFGHGGTPEEIIEGKTGYMVGIDNNVNELVDKIIYVCEKRPFKKTDIIKNGMRFAKYEHAKKMFELYNSLKE